MIESGSNSDTNEANNHDTNSDYTTEANNHDTNIAATNPQGTSSHQSIGWVNAQVHQQDSKLHAGYMAAPHTDKDIITQLYPWGVTSRNIPPDILEVKLWED